MGRDYHCSYPHPTSWYPQEWLRCGEVLGALSFLLSFVLHARSSFFCKSPWCEPHLLRIGLGRGCRGASNEPPLRAQRTGNGLYITSP